MARKLVVEIVGDASSLEKTFRRSSKAANRFGKDMGAVSRGSLAAAVSFRGLGRSIAFASAGFLGGFGLAAAVRAAFEEMSNAQKVSAQTAAVLKSTGSVAGVTAGHVEDLAQSLLNLSGVDDEVIKGAENLLLTFTNVRNVAGKNNDIFDQATRAALDLSVAMGEDLQSATVRVGKALQDPVRGITALRRVGVAFTDAQQKQIKALVQSGRVLAAQKIILRELRTEFAGSAAAAGDTLAGKLSKLQQVATNLAGAIAGLLAPSIERVVDRANKWLENTENQRRVMDTVRQVSQALADVFNALKGAFEGLNSVTGSTKRSLELLLVAFIAFKTAKILSTFTGIAKQIGLIGINAKNAAGPASALAGELGGPHGPATPSGASNAGRFARNIGKVGVALSAAVAGAKGLQELIGQAPLLISPRGAAGGVRSPVADALEKILVGGPPGPARPPAGIRGPVTRAAVAARAPGQPPEETAAQIRERTARLRQAREAFRQEVQERAQLAVDRTALTKTVADDLAALNNLNALLKRRIAGGHGTVALEREQLQVQLQINELLKQQAEARKERRDTRQFRILGLGPGGEALVPGVQNLKRQLASVTDAIQGSFLDTRKTRGVLARIRQVLKAGIGNVSKDVRREIERMLADIRAQLKDTSVDVTKFQARARGQFTAAGLHPGGGVTIQGGLHLHGVQSVQDMENALAKRRKQRARQRRSTR